MLFRRTVDVIEPGPSSEVNALAHSGMQKTENASPYPDVTAEITGDWISASAKNVERAWEQCDAQQNDCRICRGKAHPRQDIFVGAGQVENRHAGQSEGQKNNVMAKDAGEKATIRSTHFDENLPQWIVCSSIT